MHCVVSWQTRGVGCRSIRRRYGIPTHGVLSMSTDLVCTPSWIVKLRLRREPFGGHFYARDKAVTWSADIVLTATPQTAASQ